MKNKHSPNRIVLTIIFLCVLLSACTSNQVTGDRTGPDQQPVATATQIRLGSPMALHIAQKPEPTTTPTIAQATPTALPPTSSQTGEDPGLTGPETIANAVQAVFTKLNKDRADAGLPPMAWNDALARSAHKHNLRMLAADQLAHQLPGEQGVGERVRAEGINTWNIAENIGYGWGDATEAAVSLHNWMLAEKPPNDGHRKNILSDGNQVGIDVVVGSNNKVWLTQDFARL